MIVLRVAGSNFAKAALDGAKTVKGPGPSSAASNPEASRALYKVLRLEVSDAISVIVFDFMSSSSSGWLSEWPHTANGQSLKFFEILRNEFHCISINV